MIKPATNLTIFMDESKLWRQSAAFTAVAYSIGSAAAASAVALTANAAAVAAAVVATSTRKYYILI